MTRLRLIVESDRAPSPIRERTKQNGLPLNGGRGSGMLRDYRTRVPAVYLGGLKAIRIKRRGRQALIRVSIS